MRPKGMEKCGCCEPGVAPTPEEIKNRPGLPALSYRVGTYSSFRRAMIEGIRRTPELMGWTARSSDDYGIALMEMWAYLADILTFYQERIANEAFVRTAVNRDAVMRLVAMLDYRLNPGAAAAAHLAFFVEDGAEVAIPVGLRVQSVPGQDEKPQKFETVEAVTAVSALNKVRVFPRPEPVNPFAQESPGGTLIAGPGDLSAGDRLVVFDNERVELKEVEDISVRDGREILRWSPPVSETGFSPSAAGAFRYSRRFRLFGYNAPESYDEPYVDVAGDLKWRTKSTANDDYSFNIPAGTETFHLDGVYDDLMPGTRLLFVGAGFTRTASVSENMTVLKEFGPLKGTVSGITLDSNPDEIPDLSNVLVYELDGPQVELWNHRYPETIGGSAVYVPLDGLEGVEKGRRVLLDDEDGAPGAVIVTGTAPVDTDGDGIDDHLEINFTPELDRLLDAPKARMYGNVAKATHGETVSEEVLGSGDAARGFQSFELKRSPTTFVPDPDAPNGASNTLELRVGGVLWREVESLYGQGPTDTVYITRVDDEGKMTVRTGDSKRGARLPTGQDNVTATYRQGLGRDGNVRANSITTLLDKPVGLKAGTNPGGAEGGTDPEPLEDARKNAPNTVRTFERAIALRDYEDIARGYTGIAKARAVLKREGEDEFVQLTIAGEYGHRIEPGSVSYDNFKGYLDLHRDPNHFVAIKPHDEVLIKIEATVRVDRRYVKDKVVDAARKALLDRFAFSNRELGDAVRRSDIYAVLQAVEGVDAAVIERLDYKNKESTLEGLLTIEAHQVAALRDEDLEIGSDLASRS